MKKEFKKIIKLIPIIFVLVLILTIGNDIFANGVNDASPIKPNIDSGKNTIGGVVKGANIVWNTAIIVLQIAAMIAMIFAGVRYMFASADTKADIKSQTLTLFIGAAIAFGSVTVVQFIISIITSISKTMM